MKSPKVGKQRSAARPVSLARSMPRLSIPAVGSHVSAARPKPNVGKPAAGKPVKDLRNG